MASLEQKEFTAWWERLATHGENCALWDRGARVSYRDLLSAIGNATAELAAAGVRQGEVIDLELRLGTTGLARLLAGLRAGAIVFLLRAKPPEHPAPSRFQTWDWREKRGIERKSYPDSHPLLERLRARRRAGLIFQSGGTTRCAKLVLHDAFELLGALMKDRRRDYRLVVIMPPTHIGGFDAVARALWAGATVVVPERVEPSAVIDAAGRADADVLVTTPSFLNLMRSTLPNAMDVLRRFRVIAHGAEPMSATLLAQLTQQCPDTKFRNRFGTTETGAVMVNTTADNSFTPGPGVEFRIVNGELWLRQRGTMLGYLNQPTDGLTEDGWLATGDLVEESSGGALRLKGRRESTINVGGNKVHAEEVEFALQHVAGVEALRARAEPHAIMGQVVAVDVVLLPSETPSEVRRRIRENASAQLPVFARPVSIRIVAALALTDVGKLARGPNFH